jgi:prophage tail gpP-like protein
MNRTSRIILRVGEIDYTDFCESLEITRAIDNTASSFQFTLSNTNYDDIRIPPGTLVQILYEKELLVTGYMDTVQINYSATSHAMTFSGRSKTKDLIDCSALNNAQFVNQNVFTIAKALAADYNIPVVLSGISQKDLPLIPNFQVEQNGSSVFSALDNIAKLSGIVFSDTPEGALIITKPGKLVTNNKIVVTAKDNTAVLSCDFKISEADRFSEIQVKGQNAGSDTNFGKNVSKPLGIARDPEMGKRRRRVKIIQADAQMDSDDANRKAMWDMKCAAGKSTEVQYSVQDWAGNGAQLWRENMLVEITDEYAGIKNVWLCIGKITYQKSISQGTTCQLTLNPADAFLPDTAVAGSETDANSHGPKIKVSQLRKDIGASTSSHWNGGKLEVTKVK